MIGKKKPLDGLFAQLQDIKDENGNLLNTVLFSEKGDSSVIIGIENPVQQYCTDPEQYMVFTDVLNDIASRHWARAMRSRSRTSSASSSTIMS